MIDGIFVVDAIVHAYDFSQENVQDNRVAQSAYGEIWASLGATFPPDRVVSQAAACSDWPGDWSPDRMSGRAAERLAKRREHAR